MLCLITNGASPTEHHQILRVATNDLLQSDDDMPDLEGEDEKAEADIEADIKGKGKAEEVEEVADASKPKIEEVA